MDFAKLQERLKQKKQDLKQREKTLKPAPGTNRYVILPGWRSEDRETLYHEFGQHYIKNPAVHSRCVSLRRQNLQPSL